MIRILPRAAVAAAFLLGSSAAAQTTTDMFQQTRVFGPNLQITPWVGFAAAASRVEYWTILGSSGAVLDDRDVQLAAGLAGGVSVEMKAFDRFAFVAGGAYVSRGRTRETLGGVVYQYLGSNFLMGKAALAVRLRESTSEIQLHNLSATIFAGPAFVREMPKTDAFVPAVMLEPLNHWAANFGADAVFTLPNSRLSFQAGIEDFMVWWNAAELARRYDAVLSQGGTQTDSYVEIDPSHNLVFRAGLSFRLR